jgi:hypothetical protein
MKENSMPSRAQQVMYAVCVSAISFWVTVRVFEPLWPKAVTRPLVLPMFWLLLTSISFLLCGPSLSAFIKGKRWAKAAVVAFIALAPIFAGYLALLLQQYTIGFVLGE